MYTLVFLRLSLLLVTATVPTTFFSNPLYTTIIVVGVLFFLLCGMVFIFFCVLYICQRQQRKAITESQEIILGEIRTRREGRRSRPTTPRGKVTPEPPADDNGNTTKMAAVPPSHEMEDPKIAWIWVVVVFVYFKIYQRSSCKHESYISVDTMYIPRNLNVTREELQVLLS